MDVLNEKEIRARFGDGVVDQIDQWSRSSKAIRNNPLLALAELEGRIRPMLGDRYGDFVMQPGVMEMIQQKGELAPA